ncbi:unnamed protein product [Microthlaspi erraticum]|uniref:Phytocyanin domain-containing protein n=1 Tax=Microthlaspi erraticum TaxID=1685480 RepID=A0A6D2HBT8_9BRAS|nr:unnamed protein product [Microthlaspi erraticum]CAA7019900.1 unnamed protein product [Microthlaspi erraticum]CAA7049866.1 unnamed protein product [Microthlaspi erraticum]
MDLSVARKLLLVLVFTACVFSGTADAWSWSWSSGRSGSHWGWGWGSSGSSGSSWGWGWSSHGRGTGWGWGSSSGSNHWRGTGSTHKSHHNHTAPSNHSSGGVGSPHNHTIPSNHSSGTVGSPNNHTSPSNHSSGSVGSPNNHTAPSNHSSGSVGSPYNDTTPIPPNNKRIELNVWQSGFDYKEWAIKHAPFYVNDVVAFKFNNGQKTNKNKTDVYLLPDMRSYKLCDVSGGRKLVPKNREAWSINTGGFTFLLRRRQIYYFVSGDRTGCNHKMKFALFAE